MPMKNKLNILIFIFWGAILITLFACSPKNNNTNENSLIGISFAMDKITLEITETKVLNVVIEPFDYVGTISFSSSLPNVASVSEIGVVTALSIGTTTVTATLETKSATILIDVVEKLEENIIDLEGLGKESDPFLIKSLDDLELLKTFVNNDYDFTNIYFKQENDIEINSSSSWTPIGMSGIPFNGIYDGNNKKISNLYIETEKSFQGLFGFVTGTIKNLSVYGEISVRFNGPYSHSYAGGIAGAINNGAIIDNCQNYVNVQADSYVGGIVGYIARNDFEQNKIFAKIINCTNYGTITVDDEAAIHENARYIGGIVGRTDGIVKNCINNGNVITTGNKIYYVGGITGYQYLPYRDTLNENELLEGLGEEGLKELAITNCQNNGEVKGYSRIGGIVGQNSLAIIDCQNNGKITGFSCVAGISGMHGTSATKNSRLGYIENCINTGEIIGDLNEGPNYVGGIVGYSYLDISNSFNSGNIKAYSYVGGIVGQAATYLDECINEGLVEGEICVGGIVGVNGRLNEDDPMDGSITNSINKGIIIGEIRSIGGIAGYNYNDITNSNNEGEIRGSNSSYNVGGIVGYNAITSIIKDCENKATGNVSGYYGIGGIVGWNYQSNSLVLNCINRANVTSLITHSGASHIGGIVGMHGSTNKINESTNYGVITGVGGVYSASNRTGGVGGIAGSIYSNSIVENSINNGDVYGISRLGGIVGFTNGNSGTYIRYSINNATIISSASKTAHTAGIVGYMTNGNLLNCENNGYYSVASGVSSVSYIIAYKSNVVQSGNINNYVEANE